VALEDAELFCTVVSNTDTAYRYDFPASTAAANTIVSIVTALEELEFIMYRRIRYRHRCDYPTKSTAANAITMSPLAPQIALPQKITLSQALLPIICPGASR
jgi:hypothetical protein